MAVHVVMDGGLDHIEGETWMVTCRVTDDDHPDTRTHFRYVVTPEADTNGPAHPHRAAVSLRSFQISAATESVPSLTISEARDLPLAKWEQAARATAVSAVTETYVPWVRQLRDATPEEVEQFTAEVLVKAHHPEVFDSDTPGVLRRRRSLMKMAAIAIAYMNLLREGRLDPAAEIARRQGLPPATIRSWVHRSRQAGFLPAAIGRTAGIASVRR